MAALNEAGVKQNIIPFADSLAEPVNAGSKNHATPDISKASIIVPEKSDR